MKTYQYPTIEIVRLDACTSLLDTLGASGDIHSNTITSTQSVNRAPGRSEVF